MPALPQDVVTDLRRRVADLEQKLQSSFLERDEAIAQQAATELENDQLLSELRATRDRQTASAEILGTIASASGDAERSLQQIAETTARLFGATSVTVLVAEGDEWGQTIRVGDGSKHVGTEVPVKQFNTRARNLPGTVFRENRQIHIPDLDNVDSAIADWPGLPPARAAGTRVMAGTPLRREGTAIGALIVYRDRLAPFTEEELALQQSFADRAAIAIENSRLFDEVQAKTKDLAESLQQQTATADVLKVISRSTFDLQAVLDTLVESASKLCGADQGMFLLFQDGVLKPLSYFGSHADKFEFRKSLASAPTRGAISGRAVLDGHTVHVPDVLLDPEFTNNSWQELTGFRAMLAVPLMREGRPIGAMALSRIAPGLFAGRQVELVQTFADQAVIAIENARLFDEVQARTRDLTEALTYQTGSSNILKVIASSPTDVGPVLKAIADSACELCEAHDALVHLREGNHLRYRAHHGPIPFGFAKLPSGGEPIPFGSEQLPINRNWITGRSVVDKVPVHVHDVLSAEGADFPEAQRLSRREGTRTILSVPLLRDNESIGAIVLRRTEVNPFSEKQIALLQTFADQAVIAIGNVRLFEQVQQRTRELATSLDELRTAQDRLVQTEKLASLGQLTAGIAHEIKNPLNFVNNFAALSAELTDELNDVLKLATVSGKIREEVDELTGMLKDNLQKVVQHGKRADSIVKNMLLHSRGGSGDHRPADINALLDESLNLAYHGARAEKPQFNVTLQRDFDEMAGTIEVFPQEITRVFLNLISNGFYAVTKRKMQDGSTDFEPVVHAATRNLGDTVEIRIRDNGTGIPPEVKEKMFNPFFTTKPAGEGTGLGLSMSHDIIVKQHGGTIDVETAPGQFTEFTILLPRTSSIANKTRGQT
jgi:signal transduction histidine kinase